ncbi:MAG: hypothetical protein M3Y13_15590, partial [Armatimonadota bacterium]|nr:hypothetical protein [Armatimonadota bacterium]
VGIGELIDSLGAIFSLKDWRIIATVLPLEPSAPFVQAVTQRYNIEHRIEEVSNTVLNGVPIGRAFIITANPSPVRNMQFSAAA